MIEIFKKKNRETNQNNIQKTELNNLQFCSCDTNNLDILDIVDKTADRAVTANPHIIDPNNLIGEFFGDYVVVDGSERDGSGHKLWYCVCPNCGDSFKTTSYELIKGRKKTVCKKCEKARLETASTSTINNSTINNPNITYDTYNPIDNNNHSCAPTNNVINELVPLITMKADGSINGELYAQVCNKVFVRELKEDLLSMPVYYNIVHCIPADLTVHGITAQRIEAVYDLVNLLKHDYMDWKVRPDVGDVNYLKNVFTLFVTPKKYARPSMEDLRKCVANLAQECVDLGIMHLAMPRIGCGHNKLNWDEVKDMICEEFKKVYVDSVDACVIHITFCYQ